ncbi:MAG: DUF2298 domain-containing protein [Casimicrobiaceae bacterium]
MTAGLALAWNDGSFQHAFVWWGTLLLLNGIGWLALRHRFQTWHDRGWAIARPLFLFAFALAIWAWSHVFPAFQAGLLWAVLGVATLMLIRAWRREPALHASSPKWRTLGLAELRFLLPFVLYLLMRGWSHDIIGLEKFMDVAFVNASLRSSTMPPPDPWFVGQPISYYYFGHYVAAFLCKLTGIPPAFGYNLMLATLFAGVFQLSYAFVLEMTNALDATLRNLMALIAGVWLTVGGNIHGFFYGFVKPWLVDASLVAAPRQSFLVSDPTRFVGWDPLTDDKLIHEFPAYAFYVGDLHAHLSNLPQVLLLLCLLLQWLRTGARGWLVASGALVGIFVAGNTWDALMYAALLGGLLLSRNLRALPQGWRGWSATAADGLIAAVVTVLVALPFLLHFRPGSSQFLATYTHTPVWQWLVLYGEPTLLALAGCAVASRIRELQPNVNERSLLFAMTAFGISYALIPEFIFLKDIYGADHYRANTAFKFGFQAFVLLTLAACVSLALLVSKVRDRWPLAVIVLVLELALVPPLYYSWFVLTGGLGVWHEREWTLDGYRYLALSYPEDLAAIAWLNRQEQNAESIVEAVGDSYTYAARIAANTGLPTILGWPVHEQLWRASDPVVWRRRDDVNAVYEATDAASIKAILARYGTRWLVIGRYERERYPALNTTLLESLGKVVFRQGATAIVDLASTTRAAAAPK